MEAKREGVVKKFAILAPVFLLILLSAIMIPVHAYTESDAPKSPAQSAGTVADEPAEDVYVGPSFTTEDGFRVRLNSDGQSYAIVGYVASARNIVIPRDYKGIKITRIANSAFMNKRAIEHVTLNEQIEYIGEGAFDGCDNLVFESDGVGGKYLGTESNDFYYFYKPEKNTIKYFTVNMNTALVASYAFSECTQIEEVTIPEDVKYIGYKAIGNAQTLKKVTLPFVGENGDGERNGHLGYVFGARTIGGNVSFAPQSLREVYISGGDKIAKNSFYGIDMIETLTLPYLGESATDTEHSYIGYIYGADSYSDNVNIPASIKNITVNGGQAGAYIFNGCAKIENVILKNCTYTGGTFYGYKGCDAIVTCTIPDGVTSIGDESFRDCSNLASIEIPDSVTSIEERAFHNCSSLTSVTIGNGVTSIENEAFYGCRSLIGVYITDLDAWCHIKFGNYSANPLYNAHDLYINNVLVRDITIPDSVTSIGERAFYNCSSLTSVTIGNGVTSIGNSAFYGCRGLTSVTIPDTVTSIGNSAFSGCSGLTSITIPDSVTSIGSSAFFGCSSLTSITIPNSVTSIGSGAFSGCSGLTSITIPDSVTSIGSSAFSGCSSLTSITISDGVTSIGSYAFSGCSSLMSVKISGSVRSIGSYAFSGCSSLTSIKIFDGVTSIGDSAFFGCSSLTSITIPDGVTSIGGSAFSGCSSLTSITIPDGVTSIGNSAFLGCSSLTSITIPDSVTSIGWYAFRGCISLTSITIPDGVTSIGGSAFEDCNKLASVHIGKNVQSIENDAFANYPITDFEIDPQNSYFSVKDNILYDKEHTKILTLIGKVVSVTIPNTVSSIDSAFKGCESLQSIIFEPNSKLTSIEWEAFSGCSGLTSITIPNSVTNIGDRAFYNCSSLTSITIPDGVTSIGGGAFSGCSNLTSITIPDGVTSIGGSAFSGCSSLMSITIPNSVTSIGHEAFSGCRSLTSITIPDGVTSIGWYAFSGCRSLTSITIPDSVTSIGASAFSGCSGLTSITIPDSVTSIGDSAFEGCSSLTSITIPDSVTSIGNYAFSGCSSLMSVKISGSVRSIGSYAFSDCSSLTNITIPAGVTSIGQYTFSGCSSLTSITIPAGVTSIGNRAFSGCSSLYYIKNHSSLTFTIGSTENGHIAYYAKAIEDKDGNLVCGTTTSGIKENDFLFYRDITNGNYTLVAYLGKEDTVTLPQNIFGNAYTISQMCGVKNVIIPNGVTSIGDSAFSGCRILTSITIPDGVTSIGSYAFSGCSSLTSITIPDSVTSIGSSAFYNCNSLKSIVLPGNLRSIGSGVFHGCAALTEIRYSGEYNEWRHVTKASDWDEGFTGRILFAEDSGLQFETDSSITEFYLAGYNGVGGAVDVKDLFAGRAVTEVYPYGLYNNSLLTDVTLPDSIKTIGEYAFAGCTGLADFTVPEGVVYIGIGAFANTELSSVHLGYIGQSKEENTFIGWIFGAEDFTQNSAYVPETLADVYVANTDKITDYAFYGCENVVNFHFSESVTEIGNYSFYGCLSLANVGLPNTVTSIGNYAFADCRALTEFVFPDSVVRVGSHVLHRDNNIKSVVIGSGLALSGIADYANDNPLFGLDKSSSLLEQYIVASENTEFITDEYGVLYLKLNIAQDGGEQNVPVAVVDAPASSNLSYYTLPQYIVEIMPYAFAYNSTLKTVELEYVRRIGNNAFMECDKLINVIFSDPAYDTPERLRDYIGHKQYSQRIESRAFMGCRSLLKADLQVETIIEVGDEAFLDCNQLKTVILGRNVRELGSRAFGASDVGGSTLERIEVAEGNSHFMGIDGVLFAMQEDGTLTLDLYPACKPIYADGEILYVNGETQYAAEYRLPDVDNDGNAVCITGIESYAFTNAVYLDDLIVDPRSDLRVGDYAFADSMIQYIYIGKNVTSLGLRRGEGEYTVFSGDRYLTQIEVSAENPYYSSVGGVLFDKNAARLIKYPAAKAGREYIVPSSVNTIASMAFKDNKNIGLVTVNSDLYVVGLEAFYGCTNLQVIFFNHAYAPHAVMENAFTVNTGVNAEENQAVLGYSPSCYDDFGDSYGWNNYDGIYNILMYDIAPVYEPKHGVSIYYAFAVVDNAGRPLDAAWVSVTDYNGNVETVEARNGIATFWSYANAADSSFALSFNHKYALRVYDGDGLYTPYINDEVYLDGKALATYITLEKDMAAFALLQPSVAGVSCNGKEINSESVEINKEAFDYDGIELIDLTRGYSADNVRSIGVVHETVSISVVAYFHNAYKAQVADNACVLTQNGTPIQDCELVQCEVRDGSATYTFDVPVYRLIPETPIKADFEMSIKGETFTANTVLNIDVIDFSITQDDIRLGTDDVTMDLSAAGEVVMELLDGKSKSFNISKNIKAYIDIEDSEITVGLRGDWQRNITQSNLASLDAKEGFERYKTAHNKGSYFFQYKTACTENRNGETIRHNLTYNIRYYKDPYIDDFYYYRMYIYEDAWKNNIATLYGKVNGKSVLSVFGLPDNSGKSGRERLAQKAQIAFWAHYSKLLLDLKKTSTSNEEDFKKIVAKGYIHTEQVPTKKYQSTTSHTFSLALAGELVFKYDRDRGLHLVSGSVTGEAGYAMRHSSQFVVWCIPVTLDVKVDLNGKVNVNVVIDENRKITMDEAKMTVSANISASAGVGFSWLSLGVTGSIGTVFVLDFYPEFGVESWNINGTIGLYGKILWWRKDWTLWHGSYDIVKSNVGMAQKQFAARNAAAMYLASGYERITPEDVSEDATLFMVGDEIYKLYYENAYGREGYDENNFIKLAVAKWMGSDWSDGILVDDNGHNDAHYALYNDNGAMKVVFVQSTDTESVELDDVYSDASRLVIKTADIIGGNVQNVMSISSQTANYSYLHQISVVDSVPTAVWAENADNNVFGVSPHNYIDANGESHVYATTANSVWMSRWENGAWGAPVCLKDGLSVVTNLVLTSSGDVYYIEDTNGDLSDTDDRALFGKRRSESEFGQVNGAQVSVTNVYADGEYVVYRAVPIGESESEAGLYKRKNSSTDSMLVLPKETMEQIPDNYKQIVDEDGNVFAYLYYDNETWKDGSADAVGSALYGVFYDGGWSNPVTLISASDDAYITSFSAYKNEDDALFVTVSYTDGDGTRAWSDTRGIKLQEKATLVEYEADYKEQILYVTVSNNGVAATDISVAVDGTESVLTNRLKGGETETFGIRISDNKTPVVKLSAGTRVFGSIKGVDFAYSDLAVYSKQIVVGGKNILLVAVRNNGNVASDGELFITAGTDISDIEAVGQSISIPSISVGGIYYSELSLDDLLSEDSDVVALYIKSGTAEPSESLLKDNVCYVTYNACTLAAGDVRQTPKLFADHIERVESDTQPCTVEYNACAYYVAHVYCGKTVLSGNEFRVHEDTRQVELLPDYVATLAPGSYAYKVEFVGVDGNYICEFTLKIIAEYKITWSVDNGVRIVDTVYTVREGAIPNVDFLPSHVDDIGYTYEFVGWDSNADGVADKIEAASADATYVALFERKAKKFTVTWKVGSIEHAEQYAYIIS